MYTTQQEAQFTVVGIGARTSNAIEMQGNGNISKLWQRFFAEDILSKIPNKSDYSLIALYYNFESDKDGEYNYLLGARVDSVGELPEGLVAQQVPAEKRAVFTSEVGAFPQIVIDTWQKIWHLEDEKQLDRTYSFEYELYDERSQDPAHAQMEIHISIK